MDKETMNYRGLKCLTVNGVKYKYYYVDKDHPYAMDEDGFVLVQDKKIYISKEPERPIEKVVVHEDLHAVLQEAGIVDLDIKFEHALIENILKYILAYYKRVK